jgi:hypothetical protein
MPTSPKKTRKKKNATLRDQVTKTQSLGSKIVKSKDILDPKDAKVPSLFTTQKKMVLEFADEAVIPSKFIFPIFDSDNKTHHRSDISNGLETIIEFIEKNIENHSVKELVDEIRKVNQKITEPEALFYIYDVIKGDQDYLEIFKKEIPVISFTYSNFDTFLAEKQMFESKIIPKLMERDKIDLENLNQYFKFLIDELPPVPVSDMTISKMTIEYDIKLNDPTEDLITITPDLFAQMKTNYNIPYIQYNDPQFKKYKVYNGETFETRPPFKHFKNRFKKFDQPNMLYLILLSDPSPDMSDYTKKSYIPAQINLEKNILSFKYFVLYNRPEKEIIESIQNLLPQIDFLNRREMNYGAYFSIYNTQIREDSFLDMLISEPFSQYVLEGNPRLFSGVLFLDEFEKPASEKKKLKIYYDTNIGFEDQNIEESETRERKEELSKMASLGFYMTQYKSGENDSEISKGRYTITEFDESEEDHSNKLIGTKDTIVKSLFLELNTPYITINISKAVNRYVLFQFMNVFARLLNWYNQTKNAFEEEYEKLIPDLKSSKMEEEELSLIQNPKKKVGKERYGKINLSTIAPEIFTKSYSRDCQYSNQPIIIPEGEIKTWEKKVIKKDDKPPVKRPVKELGDYFFVCPTDQHPYVDFKRNLDEDKTFDKYPCCYKSEQGEVRERQKGTTYRSDDPIKTNKVMAEGGIATLPTPIDEMLKGAFEQPLTFFRMGSFISPSSFLACICLALDDRKFINQKTLEDKDQYLNDLRMEIANHGNFLTTSSELFDVSEKDRMENFKKLNEFLDPTLYYRVLEEMFGINIFVFSTSFPKPNVDPVYSLEISRFSSIPIHSFKRGAPTVLIYKHWGSETDHLEYPQCELIVTGVDKKKDALLFHEDIARYLLKGYFIASEVYGKIFIPEQNMFEKYSSKFLYNVIQMDFIGSFMNPKSPVHAIGQLIDEKGKLCGLQLKTPKGKMTVGVPPLPPQDLPMITQIEKPYLSDVLQIFRDEPTGFTYSNRNVISVWFRLLTMEYGIEIPIQPISQDKVANLPSVLENRFVLEPKKSDIQRLLKLQKDVNIIVQLIRWIYLISISSFDNLTQNSLMKKGEQFWKKYVELKSRSTEDSANDYDFSNLPRKLPTQRNSIPEILKEIQIYAPSFTDGTKIFIYGQVFYERIYESLIHYIRLNLPIWIPNYLDGFYESVYDYPVIPKTLIFLSEIDFERWLKIAVEDPTSTYPVFYSLKTKLSETTNPYLYSIEKTKPTLRNPFGESVLFLIQNQNPDNGKVSALHNALVWKQKQINHPKISDKDLSEFNNYKVFTVSERETLELVEDKSNPQDLQNTLFILNYPNSNIYASILTI